MASLEEAVRRIRLSDCETRIFECMRECVRTNAALLGVELRIAGGWVRDKVCFPVYCCSASVPWM